MYGSMCSCVCWLVFSVRMILVIVSGSNLFRMDCVCFCCCLIIGYCWCGMIFWCVFVSCRIWIWYSFRWKLWSIFCCVWVMLYCLLLVCFCWCVVMCCSMCSQGLCWWVMLCILFICWWGREWILVIVMLMFWLMFWLMFVVMVKCGLVILFLSVIRCGVWWIILLCKVVWICFMLDLVIICYYCVLCVILG